MPKDSGIGAAIKRREDARFLLGTGRYSDDILSYQPGPSPVHVMVARHMYT